MTDEEWNKLVTRFDHRGGEHPVNDVSTAESYAIWVNAGCPEWGMGRGPDSVDPKDQNKVFGFACSSYFRMEHVPAHLVQYLDNEQRVGYLFARHNDPIVRPWLEARWNGGGL